MVNFYIFLIFVCFFVAVFDLLHDIVAIFRLPYKLIKASGNIFGNVSGRFTCETTICIFVGITNTFQ